MQVETNQFLASSLSPTSKDVQLAEDFDVMECSTDEASETEVESRSASLERTTSQAAAQLQIQGVTGRLEKRRESVKELRQSVAALSCEGDLPELQATNQLMDAARKQARHLGEDLLEDLLALDKLSGLITEDRSARKAAIAGIDSLLEDVDASKACLSKLQKQIQNGLEQANSRQRENECEEAESLAPEKEKLVSPPRCSRDNTTTALTLPGHGDVGKPQQQQQLQLPAPESAMWKDLVRDVDFQTRHERGSYTLFAALPGLSTEDLEIEVRDDQTALTINGLCVPTSSQAEQMQKELLMQLQRLARSSPQRFRQLSTKLDKVASQKYTERGQGRFGSFSETFRLPSDVDVQRIRASFKEGVLRITLPRRVLREPRPMTARHPYGHLRGSGLWGHPSFGW